MAEEAKLKSQMGSDEPVKFTDEELSNELKNIELLYKKHSCILNNASESKESRLPYDRFSAYKI